MKGCVLQHAKDSLYADDGMLLSYLHYERRNEIHELTARFIFLGNEFLDDEACASLHASNRRLFRCVHSNSE